MASRALLQNGDEPEESRGRDAMIEHLQDDTVQRSGLAREVPGLSNRLWGS